ncbi:hypothetical protein VTK73DRAFT_3892 [Phialemonium thermophilum]|uniref:Uncharacterized protein n=1 Tax=Phialemonium thermophilum TaxID=223376 RepID=A0ABR3VDC4_9PEZI
MAGIIALRILVSSIKKKSGTLISTRPVSQSAIGNEPAVTRIAPSKCPISNPLEAGSSVRPVKSDRWGGLLDTSNTAVSRTGSVVDSVSGMKFGLNARLAEIRQMDQELALQLDRFL